MKLEGSIHTTVLLQETIHAFNLKNGDTILDATLGGGGIEREIERRFKEGVKVIGIDADRDAVERAKKEFSKNKSFSFYCENFRNLGSFFSRREGGSSPLSAVLFDLGISSDQLEHSGRGFSFLKDEPLQMTFRSVVQKEDITAARIVNEWGETEIANLLFYLGEEPKAKRIAKEICEARKQTPITTTAELARLIKRLIPRRGKIHPATKTFQALRIAVNGELTALQQGLQQGLGLLSEEGGRLLVISFHSLEDRIVKKFMREQVQEGSGTILTKKVIIPSRQEQVVNPRSRSAKLRVFEKKRHS